MAKTQENTRLKNKIKNGKNGITLIALVVTIIVLLILAGISISMLSGDNSILQRATDAKTNTEEFQIKEKINLAYHSALVDSQGSISEDLFAKELNKEFGTRNEKYTLINSKDGKSWTVSINGTNIKENITKPTNLQTEPINPEVEYGYAGKPGVVDASSLVEGDIINYYYDKEKEPISCAVLYNDNQHGLQIVSLDSVREITLGSATELSDEKALEAFSNGIPNGYYDYLEAMEKGRWSYNHAFQTLKEYALDYIGNMAINARCIGAPESSILEGDEDNMSIINCGDYIIKQKNNDNWYLCDELKKMESLGILNTANSKEYWIASRYLKINESPSAYNVTMALRYIDTNGTVNYSKFFLRWGYIFENNKFVIRNVPQTFGLRPLFILRNDIKIEKTGHLN